MATAGAWLSGRFRDPACVYLGFSTLARRGPSGTRSARLAGDGIGVRAEMTQPDIITPPDPDLTVPGGKTFSVC